MQTLVRTPTTFLDAIASPDELKKLSIEDLRALSAEIRSEIVHNLNKTGGHLASNLGIVEITLALHYVFDSPKDKILWDVGHQAYVHKMLTGRRDKFHTLRQFKGLSGFIHPAESEHDAFIAGHSSTSVSLAVGMALARDHQGSDEKVIALIGDGGLTGGMALEAINHLGHIQKDVLILLNDNDMSISENLGGFSQYMKRIKETYFYRDIKEKIDWIENMLDGAPLDDKLREVIESVKQEARERIDTPGIVFEKLGVNYTGPIDGHDVGAVIETLRRVRDVRAPQIVHLITRKGKGYKPAEKDSIKYHGVKAFSLEPRVEPAADKKPTAQTYSDVFTEALIEAASSVSNIVAITPATAEGSGLVKFGKVYPERFFDVAICEQHAVTMAAGMARGGLKPVVSIYSTFLQRAMDQVIHDVAIMNLPVVFGIDRGGIVEDGETHQGAFDISYLRCIPNFTVLAPKDAVELRAMVLAATKDSSGPVAIRFPRDRAINCDSPSMVEPVTQDLSASLRKWELLSKAGPVLDWDFAGSNGKRAPIVILAHGSMVQVALDAIDALQVSGKNIDVVVINARCVKPLDEEILERVVMCPGLRVITLEEGCLSGGFGAAVLEWAAARRMKSPGLRQADIVCKGLPDRFIEHGARPVLLDDIGLSPASLAGFIQEFYLA